ncbi:MAG: radical SAM protein [Treponema sp.]|nr:radical SAM protein [Candidatus Treponema merdequi]
MTPDELLTKSQGVLVKTTLVDFPRHVASTYFLKGCNLRCPYCYNVDLVTGGQSPDLKKDDFKAGGQSSNTEIQYTTPVQVLEHLYKRQNVINGLVISGGEPLLNPVTPILIARAKSMGFKIKLDTNGTLPMMLESLIKNPETKPDFIAMDLKTSPDRYKTDIPVTQNFQNADIPELLKSSIDIIKTLGPSNYEIRTVLVPNLVTKTDIEKMAAILPHDASWQFAPFRNENCLDPHYNEIPPYLDRELKELVEFAEKIIPGSVLR